MFVVMVVMPGEYVFLLILMNYEVKEFSYICCGGLCSSTITKSTVKAGPKSKSNVERCVSFFTRQLSNCNLFDGFNCISDF